ncbi:MAG: glycosyltransferase [FCB group bacterium]|nr:glycosyltransferase [FCB group bacterium]
MGAPVSIIIPAFNQVEYCRQCVTTLMANTPGPYKLILVDNGSTDGVAEYFDSVPGACVIHSETNRGFAGGVNLGLAQAEGHALLLNSDTLLPEGWLEPLMAALERYPDAGMAGPVSNNVSGCQQIETPALESMDDVQAVQARLAAEKRGGVVETERLVGFCLLIRDAALAKVGLFDERFGIGNFEDDDYCVRVRRAGFKLLIVEDSFVFHYGSRTFAGMDLVGERWQELIARNQERFLKKWSGPDDAAREEAAALGARAREAAEQGRHADALRLFLEAIRLDSLSPALFNDLGALLWSLGEKRKAVEQFRRALRLDPGFEAARENLARAETEV